MTATLTTSITPAAMTGVETMTLTMNGASLNATNIDDVTTLNLTQSGITIFTNMDATVAQINQITGSSAAASYGYAAGAAATVRYDFDSATANVANGTTTFVNAGAITIDGDATKTVDLGTTFTAASATSLTVLGDAVALDVGATVTIAAATDVTVTGAAGAVIVGDTTLAAAAATPMTS